MTDPGFHTFPKTFLESNRHPANWSGADCFFYPDGPPRPYYGENASSNHLPTEYSPRKSGAETIGFLRGPWTIDGIATVTVLNSKSFTGESILE